MIGSLAEADTTRAEEVEPIPLRLVTHQPGPGGRGVVRHVCGYAEVSGAPLRRWELPSAEIILIVNLGAPLAVTQPGTPPRLVPTGGGFVAGLHETYTVTETAGSQAGVELRLSPPGAYRLLGQPLAGIANRSVALDDLLGRWATDLPARMQDAATWEARFTALDAALGERLRDADGPDQEIVQTWRQLARSGGRTAIATLAEELGWSPRRLIARFREQVGLPPKPAARLLRFQRASEEIAAVDAPVWCALAQRHGFYDQAHLINEFRAFAGDTPHGLLRRRLPQGGFAAD